MRAQGGHADELHTLGLHIVANAKRLMRAALVVPMSVLGIPLLFLAAALSVPYALLMVGMQSVRERRLREQLQTADRVLPWPDVEQHLVAGSGTLIVEQAQKQGLRIWWTPDDVVATAPCAVPTHEQLDYIFGTRHPFVAWCFEHYTSPDTGVAQLTRMPYKLPAGFLDTGFITNRFSRARVVHTVLQA